MEYLPVSRNGLDELRILRCISNESFQFDDVVYLAQGLDQTVLSRSTSIHAKSVSGLLEIETLCLLKSYGCFSIHSPILIDCS